MGADLLERLARRAGLDYVSDLRFLAGKKAAAVLEALEEEPAAAAASLREWNDALGYIAQAPPERSAESARDELARRLEGLGGLRETDGAARAQRPPSAKA